MATALRGEQAPSVTALVSGIVGHAQELLIQQFEIFKQEVRADFRNIKVAAQVLAFGPGPRCLRNQRRRSRRTCNG